MNLYEVSCRLRELFTGLVCGKLKAHYAYKRGMVDWDYWPTVTCTRCGRIVGYGDTKP